MEAKVNVEATSQCVLLLLNMESFAVQVPLGPATPTGFFSFWEWLYPALIPENARRIVRTNMAFFVVILNNILFHHSNHVREII